MKVHIAQVEKKDYFDQRVNATVTALGIAVHPVLSVNTNDGTADVSHEGVRPTVVFNSQVIDHTELTQALRDMADMLDKSIGNKTVEELIGELKQSESREYDGETVSGEAITDGKRITEEKDS